jgi:hypothetical protein
MGRAEVCEGAGNTPGATPEGEASPREGDVISFAAALLVISYLD